MTVTFRWVDIIKKQCVGTQRTVETGCCLQWVWALVNHDITIWSREGWHDWVSNHCWNADESQSSSSWYLQHHCTRRSRVRRDGTRFIWSQEHVLRKELRIEGNSTTEIDEIQSRSLWRMKDSEFTKKDQQISWLTSTKAKWYVDDIYKDVHD